MLLTVVTGTAQELALLRTLPLSARYLTADGVGNLYVVLPDNTIVRYDENGDSTGNYKSVINGTIGQVDATNPLRILVYYPDYNKLVLLDKMLTPISEVAIQHFSPTGARIVASAADGAIWMYDGFQAQLKKIDITLQKVVSSNDLRQELQTVLTPGFMVEHNRQVYMSDTAKGIYIFDRYGNFVQSIPLQGIHYFQPMGSHIVYLKNDTLYAWDMEKIKSAALHIPHSKNLPRMASLVRDKLYVLFDDALQIFLLKD